MLRKILLLILLIALLVACSPQATEIPAGPVTKAPATEAPVTQPPASTDGSIFVDGLGREVKITGFAQRVVSLAPSNTEILFAVGAGDQIVGRDEFSDFPEEAKAIESIGGSFGEYNAEAILALEPDLVLAAEINPPELVKQLEDLGLTVYYVKNPEILEETFGNIQNIAIMTGHEPEAEELVNSLIARVAAVDEKIATVTEQPVVFYEIDASDASKPYTYGPGTFGDLLISRAGGVNLATAAGITDPYPQVSLEQIVATNPDVIVLGDSMWGMTAEAVQARPGWEAIDAVANGQIFPFDDNLVSRPGPRLVDGLEQLAKLLHPDLFD